MSIQWSDSEARKQLLGTDIVEWRCPKCGQFAYTHKSQQALMVECSGDHGSTLVWMQQVSSDESEEA